MRNVAKGREWVTASEVAEASICPYRIYLKSNGVKHSKETHVKFAYGNAQHKRYESSHRAPGRFFKLVKIIILLLFMIVAAGIFLSSQSFMSLVIGR